MPEPNDGHASRFDSDRAAFFGAIRDYAGTPALAMASAFLGFGAIVNDAGFSVWQAVAASAGMTFIPAQSVMTDMLLAGASFASMLLAVAFVTARLLPMALSLMPLLRHSRWPALSYYLGMHMMASMAWTAMLRHGSDMTQEQRIPYFYGVAATNYVVIVGATALGYSLAAGLPLEITRGLVFLTPLFFLLLFMAEAKEFAAAIALGLGGFLGPVIYTMSPEWSVLGCGLIGGTVAFAFREFREKMRDTG